MAALPHPWGMYAQVQNQLSQRLKLDDRAWGLEAALNMLCEAKGAVAVVDVDRSAASASRKARYRLALVARQPQTLPVDPVAALEARSTLGFLVNNVPANDLELLCNIAAGNTYDDLSKSTGVRPEALRGRVSRTRRAASLYRHAA